jgi:hypothetical protein
MVINRALEPGRLKIAPWIYCLLFTVFLNRVSNLLKVGNPAIF